MFKSLNQVLVPSTYLDKHIVQFFDVLPPDIINLSHCYLDLNSTEKNVRAGLGSSNRGFSHVNFFVRDAYFLNCDTPLFAPIRDQLKISLFNCLEEYLCHLDLFHSFGFSDLVADGSFSYVIYEPGSTGYKTHVDTVTHTNEYVKRLFSCVYYLNDDYIGGELYFPSINKKIKPKANSCVLFPSNNLFPHTALSVRHKRKVICPAWFGYELPEEFNIGSVL